MQTSALIFAADLDGEGIDEVLDNVGGRAGLDGVTLAVSYHAARDVFPHNRRKVQFLEADALCYPPDPAVYGRLRIQPRARAGAENVDLLEQLLGRSVVANLRTDAWLVLLHADRLGLEHPDCVCRNAFGDPYLTDLCPANPDARAYATALVADVASRGVGTILAESLHYPLFEHGNHHERCFVPLSERDRYLLGICFCVHCLRAAEAKGIDADGVRKTVIAELERAFAAEHSLDATREAGESLRAEVVSLAAGELGGYVEARRETVSSLIGDCVEAAARSNVELVTTDPSGAAKGYATGNPTGPHAVADSWQFGLEVGDIVGQGSTLGVVGYATNPARLDFELTGYRERVGPEAGVQLSLRPMKPDCPSAENLAKKLSIAAAHEVKRVDFYHYGLAPLSALDTIREGLRQA